MPSRTSFVRRNKNKRGRPRKGTRKGTRTGIRPKTHVRRRPTARRAKRKTARRRQSGGSNLGRVGILFGCTSKNPTSTLSKNFEEIHAEVKISLDDPTNAVPKDAYFVFNPPRGMRLDAAVEPQTDAKLTAYNYRTVPPAGETESGNYIHQSNLIEFIDASAAPFGLVVFTECNDLLGNILGENVRPNAATSYDLINHNLFVLYSGLAENGQLLNVVGAFKQSPRLASFSGEYAYSTYVQHLPMFEYCLEMFNLLFTEVRVGAYVKRGGVSSASFFEAGERIQFEVMSVFRQLVDSPNQSDRDKMDQIMRAYPPASSIMTPPGKILQNYRKLMTAYSPE